MANFIDYDVVSMHTPPPQRTLTKPSAPKPTESSASQAPEVQSQQEVATPVATERTSDESDMNTEAKPVAIVEKEQPKKKVATTTKSKKVSGTKKKQTASQKDVVYLRNFPTILVLEARRQFPEAMSQTDAVAALLAVKTGIKDGLSENIKALVENYEETDEMQSRFENIDKRLNHVTDKLPELEYLLRELEFISIYSVFDYLGYRREDTPASPRNMEFLEPGMEDIIYRMREQVRKFIKDEKLKNGRPIR